MHKTSEGNRLLFVMKRRIDHVAASLRNAVVDGNRRAAFVAVKALRWLSTEMVAIRGHSMQLRWQVPIIIQTIRNKTLKLAYVILKKVKYLNRQLAVCAAVRIVPFS